MSDYLTLAIVMSVCAILWFVYMVKSNVGDALNHSGNQATIMSTVYIVVIGALAVGCALGTMIVMAIYK